METMDNMLSEIKDSDRLWIYQADRLLNEEEIKFIKSSGHDFMLKWSAHGKFLNGRIYIFRQLFIIIAQDESFEKASGCSIDQLFKWISETGLKMQADFTNRQKIAWLDQNNLIQISELKDFELLIQKGEIKKSTSVFNNLIFKGVDLHNRWIIPAGDSWHARLFPAN